MKSWGEIIELCKMNERVAKEVLGWRERTWREDDQDQNQDCLAWHDKTGVKQMCGSVLPNFSTDIQETIRPVAEMCSQGYELSVRFAHEQDADHCFELWEASFDKWQTNAKDRKLAVAICSAALNAIEHKTLAMAMTAAFRTIEM